MDDQRLMREGLRILLDLEPDLEVVGEANDGQDAVDAYATLAPDVVLMDVLGYLLKAASGEELAAAIRTVARGGALIEPSVARRVMAEFARELGLI